jgi:hypothetical protein
MHHGASKTNIFTNEIEARHQRSNAEACFHVKDPSWFGFFGFFSHTSSHKKQTTMKTSIALGHSSLLLLLLRQLSLTQGQANVCFIVYQMAGTS